MIFFDTIEELQSKITQIIKTMDTELIKSITNNDLFTKIFIR